MTLQLIPARKGVAARAKAGQTIRVVNTHGTQVVDAWAFNADDPREFMSMEHSRVHMERVAPCPGKILVTNKRRPILTMLEDTSPGVHDTTLAACDVYRYRLLGCKDYHDNCTDNLAAALATCDIKLPLTPSPLNLWENSRVMPDFSQVIEPPVSKPGDHVTFRAEMDVVLVFSSCPQDMVPTNGADGIPKDAHFEIA